MQLEELDMDDCAKVITIHTLYYEQYGCPQGIPALVLHGGPGAGCFSLHAQFFDPTRYHIVLFDQRGSGQSIPRGEVQNNTLSHLIQDCETLRIALTFSNDRRSVKTSSTTSSNWI
jgi:proline iminopeptidase